MDKITPTALAVTQRARRHSKAEIAERLAEYRASGLTAEEFATRAGLRPATLLSWQARARRQTAPSAGGAFARVQVAAARAGTLTVRWPQGVEVAVAVDLDEAAVVRVVRDLLAPCWR
jgi:transcriptional regulator with XRE-family HTH domain